MLENRSEVVAGALKIAPAAIQIAQPQRERGGVSRASLGRRAAAFVLPLLTCLGLAGCVAYPAETEPAYQPYYATPYYAPGYTPYYYDGPRYYYYDSDNHHHHDSHDNDHQYRQYYYNDNDNDHRRNQYYYNDNDNCHGRRC